MKVYGLVLLALWWTTEALAALAVVDERGVTLELPAPATRIISLAPHLTELLYAAGAGEQLVGVVARSNYPPAAAQLPVVGDHARFDIERILSLQPDLILAWASGNPRAEVERLEQLGLRVYVSEPQGLESIAAQIETLGRLAGTTATASRIAQTYRAKLADLRGGYRHRATLSVFYQIWHEPLMTVNGRHVLSDVIALCGGRNIFGELGTLAPTVSLEAVLQADPQVILTGSDQPPANALANWQRWPRLRAVRAGQLYSVPADLLNRPTPRLLDGVQQVCEDLDSARAVYGESRGEGR